MLQHFWKRSLWNPGQADQWLVTFVYTSAPVFWTPVCVTVLISQSIIVSSLFTVAPHAASWDISLSFCLCLSLCLTLSVSLQMQDPFLLQWAQEWTNNFFLSLFSSKLFSVIFRSQALEGKCSTGLFYLSSFFKKSSVSLSVLQLFHSSVPKDSYLSLSSLPFLLSPCVLLFLCLLAGWPQIRWL